MKHVTCMCTVCVPDRYSFFASTVSPPTPTRARGSRRGDRRTTWFTASSLRFRVSRDERAKHAPPPGVTTHPDRQSDPNQHPRAAHQRERRGFHSTGGLDARRRVFVPYAVFFARKRSAFRPSSRRPVRRGRRLLSSLDGFARRSVTSLVVVYVHHPKRRSFRRRRARFRFAGVVAVLSWSPSSSPRKDAGKNVETVARRLTTSYRI